MVLTVPGRECPLKGEGRGSEFHPGGLGGGLKKGVGVATRERSLSSRLFLEVSTRKEAPKSRGAPQRSLSCEVSNKSRKKVTSYQLRSSWLQKEEKKRNSRSGPLTPRRGVTANFVKEG